MSTRIAFGHSLLFIPMDIGRPFVVWAETFLLAGSIDRYKLVIVQIDQYSFYANGDASDSY